MSLAAGVLLLLVTQEGVSDACADAVDGGDGCGRVSSRGRTLLLLCGSRRRRRRRRHGKGRQRRRRHAQLLEGGLRRGGPGRAVGQGRGKAAAAGAAAAVVAGLKVVAVGLPAAAEFLVVVGRLERERGENAVLVLLLLLLVVAGAERGRVVVVLLAAHASQGGGGPWKIIFFPIRSFAAANCQPGNSSALAWRQAKTGNVSSSSGGAQGNIPKENGFPSPNTNEPAQSEKSLLHWHQQVKNERWLPRRGESCLLPLFWQTASSFASSSFLPEKCFLPSVGTVEEPPYPFYTRRSRHPLTSACLVSSLFSSSGFRRVPTPHLSSLFLPLFLSLL